MRRVQIFAATLFVVMSAVPLAASASAAPIKTNYFSGPVKFGTHCVLYATAQRALDGTPWNAIAASDLKGKPTDHSSCRSDQFGIFDTNSQLAFASKVGTKKLDLSAYGKAPKWGFTVFSVRVSATKCMDLKIGPQVGVNKKVLVIGPCPGSFQT